MQYGTWALSSSAAAAKSLQSCPTLCDPIDGSPPGSAIPGILQARTLEWVATSFSNAWKWNVKVKSLSRARLLATPWTAAYQAPLSMGFSRLEYWSGVPLPGIKPVCPLHSHPLQWKPGVLTTRLPGKSPALLFSYNDSTLESLDKVFILLSPFLSRSCLLCANLRGLWKLWVKITNVKNGQEIKISPGLRVVASGMCVINIIVSFLQIKKQSWETEGKEPCFSLLICEEWRWQ